MAFPIRNHLLREETKWRKETYSIEDGLAGSRERTDFRAVCEPLLLVVGILHICPSHERRAHYDETN